MSLRIREVLQMRQGRKPGIVLVTTLLVTVLVVMLVTAVVGTGAGGMALTGNFYEREAALLAAESGLQYAMTRLQANPNWRGDDPGTVPSGTPDFSVIERNGNVFGFLQTASGNRSLFRIKFNYEDGNGGADGLNDTSEVENRQASPLVSINNLQGVSSVPARRANPNGIGLSSEEAPYRVPRATACILVEGLAGWGVRDTSPDRPGTFSANRAVTRRVVEAYLKVDETAGIDSVAYAGGVLDAQLSDDGAFTVSSRDDEVVPRIRSLADVQVASPTGRARYDDGAEGEVVVGEGRNFLVNGSTPADAKVERADSSDRFKRLTWDSVVKARPNSSDAQLQAGTYVWRMSGDKKSYLEYFPQEFPEEADLPPAGEGVAASTAITGEGFRVDPKTLSVLISNNVYVNPLAEGDVKGLTLRSDPAILEAGLRPVVGFVPPKGDQKASVLTATGPVWIQGAVLGSGAVTSESSIRFQGPSILESDPETGVSLYAKGDITLEAIGGGIPDGNDEMKPIRRPGKDRPGRGGKDRGDDGDDDDDDRDKPGTPSEGQGQPEDLNPDAAWQSLRARGLVPEDGASTFTGKKQEQLARLLAKYGDLDYADQDLTGVIYTWGNFNALLGPRDVLNITGTLIAYGGSPEDPLNPAPGTEPGKGRIDLEAGRVGLTYDPSYIRDLMGNLGTVQLKRSLWATW